MSQNSTSGFYSDLQKINAFAELANAKAYEELPEDWFLGMSDVVGSTKEIAKGNYKTVNMVGAAIISAQINTLKGVEFPFVFGGDGATFAIPPEHYQAVSLQMAAVRQWANDEFGMGLRISLIPMKAIRKERQSISVARFAASSGVDYAMFRGSGIAWAEKQLKSDKFSVPLNNPQILPDLTGLSCRWSPMPSLNGTVLSLVIVPKTERQFAGFDAFAEKLINLITPSEANIRPVPKAGPGFSWPPSGLNLEAHASRGVRSLLLTKLKLLTQTLLVWVLFKTRAKIGGFDPIHYQKTTGLNADFRKFEGSLKMTLDCNQSLKDEIVTMLNEAKAAGIIRYGMHEQDASMMTCIVPSVMSDDHFHFIDGAKGGYTAAAEKLKAE